MHRREVDPVVLSKNDLIQRHCEIYTKILRNQINADKYRDLKDKETFTNKVKKIKSFKRLQFDAELNEQTNYLRYLIESKLKQKNTPIKEEKNATNTQTNFNSKRGGGGGGMMPPIKPAKANQLLEPVKCDPERSKFYEETSRHVKLNLLRQFKLPVIDSRLQKTSNSTNEIQAEPAAPAEMKPQRNQSVDMAADRTRFASLADMNSVSRQQSIFSINEDDSVNIKSDPFIDLDNFEINV
jgi:hypothetical protein